MLPRIRSGRRDRFAKSLASRASPAKKTLNPNDCRTWDWPGGWPRAGQLASPWPIPPRFLLNNRPIPKHRNHLRSFHINIRFTQHPARPGKNGDWLRTRCLYPFFPARTNSDCEAFSSVSLLSSTDSAAVCGPALFACFAGTTRLSDFPVVTVHSEVRGTGTIFPAKR